jgi:hypothetical protein
VWCSMSEIAMQCSGAVTEKRVLENAALLNSGGKCRLPVQHGADCAEPGSLVPFCDFKVPITNIGYSFPAKGAFEFSAAWQHALWGRAFGTACLARF